MEKDYGQAMDVWSVGCIFAELLHFLTPEAYITSNNDQNKRKIDSRYLLPGEACYPLSPGKSGTSVDYKDQMRHILDAVGNLDDCDTAFITKQSASKYVDSIKGIRLQHQNDKDISLRGRFSNVKNQRLVELLVGMLQFNPAFRMTTKECLNSEIFSELHKKAVFKRNQSSIDMSQLYGEDEFDYES